MKPSTISIRSHTEDEVDVDSADIGEGSPDARDSTHNNPYTPPPETPHDKRPVNLPRLILAASLTAALALIFFDAPRWIVVAAGAASALAAEELTRKFWA